MLLKNIVYGVLRISEMTVKRCVEMCLNLMYSTDLSAHFLLSYMLNSVGAFVTRIVLFYIKISDGSQK